MLDAQDRIIFAQTEGGIRIGTARDRLPAVRAGLPLGEWYKRMAVGQMFPLKPQAQGSVKAEINHGRWLVMCPFCPGAEEADPTQPVFYCLSCGNADDGGHIMAVEFPPERESIEMLLLVRPMENRNWKPGETIADLAKENTEHEVR